MSARSKSFMVIEIYHWPKSRGTLSLAYMIFLEDLSLTSTRAPLHDSCNRGYAYNKAFGLRINFKGKDGYLAG